MSDQVKHLEPIQVLYGCVAVAGGIARYLNSYVQGKPFKVSIFFASAFTAGFSGVTGMRPPPRGRAIHPPHQDNDCWQPVNVRCPGSNGLSATASPLLSLTLSGLQ